jgi:hypothetical protein
MARLRTGYLTLLAAGTLLLPACATSSRSVKAAETDSGPVAIGAVQPAARGTGFAELPNAPGERVARNPAPDAPKATTAAAAKPPETSPITVAVAPPVADAPLVAAVKAYLDNKPESAAEHLKLLDRPNQELMQQLVPPVVALSRTNLGRAGPLEIGLLVGQIETPLKALSSKALTVSKAVFCSELGGYGQYTPLADGHVFRPGTVAEVYLELRNVPTVPVRLPDGSDGYLTHLNWSLRLRDAAGTVVPLTDGDRRQVAVLEAAHKQYSRSPVRDYAKTFRVLVPRTPGRYTLTVEFADPESSRGVTRGMTFQVGGS